MARRLLLSLALVLPAPASHHPGQPVACLTLAACRSELAHARAALAWQRHERRQLQRRLRLRWRPLSRYAISLASRAFGVDQNAMLTVASCESGLDPTAANGQYLGLFQTGPGFWSHTPFRSFARTDPLANALATASVVRSQGWRQWSCQP